MDPELILWAIKVMKSVKGDQKAVLKNQKIMLEKLEKISKNLQTLQEQFHEQVLVEFRAAMQHLLAGLNSDVAEVRIEEFQMARGIFNKLINLDPNGTTTGTSGKISNSFLICFGYWGSFQYFSARGDHRNALIHAYECVRLYPVIACRDLNLFSVKIFSQDYGKIWRDSITELAAVLDLYQSKCNSNRLEKFFYYSAQTLRAGAAGAVGAVGAGAAYLVGALTFGVAAGPIGIVGYQAAKKVWDSISVAPPQIDSIDEMERQIKILKDKIEQLPQDLVRECEHRKSTLQRVSLKDLKNLEALAKNG